MKVNYRDNAILKLEKRKSKDQPLPAITSKEALEIIAEYAGIDLKEFAEKTSSLTKGQRNVVLTDRILGTFSKRYRKEMKQYHKELHVVTEALSYAFVPDKEGLAKECVMNEVK